MFYVDLEKKEEDLLTQMHDMRVLTHVRRVQP